MTWFIISAQLKKLRIIRKFEPQGDDSEVTTSIYTLHSPPSGINNYLYVVLPSNVRQLNTVYLVNARGQVLRTLGPSNIAWRSGRVVAFGPFLPPGESFFIRFSGTAEDGSAFSELSTTTVTSEAGVTQRGGEAPMLKKKLSLSLVLKIEKHTVSNRWAFLSNVFMSFSSGKYRTNNTFLRRTLKRSRAMPNGLRLCVFRSLVFSFNVWFWESPLVSWQESTVVTNKV